MVRITLLTDFGTEDGYVAAMKGVLASSPSSLLLEDITHSVPPGDVVKASRILSRYWRLFPPGTVHLVVVDPGVGTSRRALALRADGRYLVGPDNGVFSRVLLEANEVELVALRPSPLLASPESSTFHGRDLFAPAAALLATGSSLDALGDPVMDPIRLPEPEWTRLGPWAVGAVVEVDHFGNLGTNLPLEVTRGAGAVQVGEREIPFCRTYGEVGPGELLALLDSAGRVEIAVRNGSAAEHLGLGVGSPVRVRVGREEGE